MSNTTKHTPTPWKAVNHSWAETGIYAEDERCGGTIAVLSIEAEADEDTQAELEEWMAANAAFIVRACNAHDQLVAAAQAAKAIFERQGWLETSTDPEAQALRLLRAALDAAEA